MILVTGGAGFIGSNLIRGLNRRGIEDVLVVDDLEHGEKHLGLNALAFTDLVDYRDFLEDPGGSGPLEGLGELQAVFHQGACSDTLERDGRFMLRVNYEFSKKLLAFAQERQVPFLYASSAAVYGDGREGFREEPACEHPLNVYAFSKALFDRHVRRVLPDAPAQVVGLRYFNVYGPQENHKGRMASVVYKFHREVESEGRLRIFEGSEGFRRDFVHVDDAVDLNLHFLDHPEKSGIFNCGTGQAASFLDLARCVASQYEGAEIEEIPFPDDLAGRYQTFTQADLGRLRDAGYGRSFTPLERGVERYVEVLKESGGYYRSGAG